ncbi:MAG: asparagine synthase (glutamine-hydrolyzing) [Parcubacteria group bacterium]|nr:asparagine synthase (glutamine-hydrolyzing) [Parcubacteria group bacterium]
MCGIAGIVDLRRREVAAREVKKMTDAIAHRGPNGEGVFTGRGAGLGHRRLSILDLSAAGAQPMRSARGELVIVFNGEIYNYPELKKGLPGKYNSNSDTEVLLRVYEKWGEKCLGLLNGIFAFAIWDDKCRRFFAARDRLGVKPFYYAVHKDRFYFASEIKALLAAGVPARPNDKIIHDYLVYGYYDHSEETFFDGIKQLMPGHYLEIRDQKILIKRYWYLPELVKEKSGITDREAGEEFWKLLQDSVKLELRSDVPIGMSVSGGLDSSLLAQAVNKAVKGQKNFNLYHFEYAGLGYEKERPHVDRLAREMGWRKPHIVTVRSGDMPESALKIMWHEEQPFPGLPTVAWHKLYKTLGSTETIVTLEGHGGDEIAAGYDYYFGAFILDILRTNGEKAACREIAQFAAVRGVALEKARQMTLNGVKAYVGGGVSADASRFSCAEFLRADFRALKKEPPWFEAPFASHLANFQYRELMHTKLPRVLRSVDRESMAYGRELRVPILDHRLVELSFSLPLEQRIGHGQMRRFMRNAAGRVLSPVLAKTPKRSLPNPQRAWFQKELRPWIESLVNSRSFRARKYFDEKLVLAEYEKYCRAKDPVNAFHVWQWISIELWFRVFIDK